jgi:hypothetical protein
LAVLAKSLHPGGMAMNESSAGRGNMVVDDKESARDMQKAVRKRHWKEKGLTKKVVRRIGGDADEGGCRDHCR